MNNNYVLECDDSLAMEQEQTKIIKDNKFNKASVFKYDLEETELEKALEDLDTYGLFTQQKVIIIKNIDSLKYDDYKNDFEHLFKYLDNPNPDNLLLIEVNKLSGNSKIGKVLKDKCQYIKVEMNTKSYIRQQLRDYEIDSNTVNLLDEYCLGDISKIYNECLKLKDYKLFEKVITEDDVRAIVDKKLGDSKDLTFSFSRSIALRDKKSALKRYKELLSYNFEPISIIGLLSSQIRIIYQVKLLEKEKISDHEIANMLEEKSDYRITKTRELTKLYTEETLLHLLQELSNIDFKMKTTDLDANALLEMFIINL
ncbi:MAG: DNA polymerase III subunit delta [Bacilli bacterium]|nr:DNA polymerase III subunit delta [Bacilli bacterium]